VGALRGRGSAINPQNRFEDKGVVIDGEFLDALLNDPEVAPGAQVRTHVLEDASRSILNEVDSPDLGMRWTLNPYRGCEHGCVYCYARPGHEYLGLSSGLDFETRIFAKRDAASLLRKELARPSWKGETISLSGVTDCYQPLERELRLTRSCLEVMRECGQPVTIVTKSKLVLRDLDILRDMARENLVAVAVSLTTLDAALAAKMEPRASSPRARLDAISGLSAAGVPAMVMTAPLIPGLNDHEVPALLREASRAGATNAAYVLLRLPHQIKAIFFDWLAREFPARAAHIESLIRDTRRGALYRAEWRERQRGTGNIAEHIASTFKVFARRYGLDGPFAELAHDKFRAPGADTAWQGRLFVP